MKVTQKNIRVFHIVIDEEALFLEYFRKNSILLKEFFLLVEGNITKSIAFVLEQSGVCYKDITSCSLRFGAIKKETTADTQQSYGTQEAKQEDAQPLAQENKKLKIFDRTIRSGEEIHEIFAVTIFGRVNSGAKVFCEDCMSIYGIVDGLVECDGEYLIINGISPRGNVIFKGEIIDKESVKQNVLQKITMRNSVIEIKEMV
ncbi:MAG: septum site-determining protein MinC [Sulfurospirillaceae bacterium]|nr:septum site-determining protein MinC [Sulfurospirillaceae bacterium]